MEKSPRIAALYGYSVCLVTLIGFLMALPLIVGALVDLSDPVHAPRITGFPSTASFENYKAGVLIQWQALNDPTSLSVRPDEKTLRAMYEALKAERIQRGELQAWRLLISRGLLAVVCAVLFITHWIWVRRIGPVGG